MPGTWHIVVGGGAKRRPHTRSSVRHTIGLRVHDADREPLLRHHTYCSLPFASASLRPFSPKQFARPTSRLSIAFFGCMVAQDAAIIGSSQPCWHEAGPCDDIPTPSWTGDSEDAQTIGRIHPDDHPDVCRPECLGGHAPGSLRTTSRPTWP